VDERLEDWLESLCENPPEEPPILEEVLKGTGNAYTELIRKILTELERVPTQKTRL